MTTMIDQQTQPEKEIYSFTALDRCDAKCQAQAYHRCTKGESDLFFCNHHYEEYKEQLFVSGFDVESDAKALADLGVKHYIYIDQ